MISKEERALVLRLIVFLFASIVLILTDHNTDYLKTVRTQLLAGVYPIQYLVDWPVKAGQSLSKSLNSRFQLLGENANLREDNLRLQVKLQRFEDIINENKRLRRLLNASKKSGERVEVAEVLAVEINQSRRKILINKGLSDGVFTHQPVIDAQGVIGQVIQVGINSSIVMLITDPEHELPVQVVRTGLRTVAKGMGTVNRLSLLYLSNTGLNTGIKVGDLIVTSGAGQKFPKGYPVATVIQVNPDIGKPYAQGQAQPRSTLERNREVLLIWQLEKSTVTNNDFKTTNPQ
jgi:rod shape-determining protein MreC